MKIHFIKTALIFLFFGATLNSWGQSPEKFSYQAVVRDGNDVLLTNSPIGVRISILQGSITGTAVFEETHTSTSNDNGLITIEIGNGASSIGSIQSIDWSAGPYFIKNELDLTGGTSYALTGVSELLSVPYAEYAKNGLPTSFQGNTLRTDGNGDWVADNFIYNNGQYVGINQSSPIGSSVFDISKTTSGTEYGGMYINTTSDNGTPFLGFATDGIGRAWFEFRGSTEDLTFYNGSNYVFTVSADNNVGINNTDPQYSLDVNGTLRFDTGTSATDKVLIANGADGTANWGQVGDNQIEDVEKSIFYSYTSFSDESSVSWIELTNVGYIFQNNAGEGLNASLNVPADWDGVSPIYADLYFYQNTTNTGTAGFFIRHAGIDVGEVYTTDPGSTSAPFPVMSNVSGTLHKQTFQLASDISIDDDLIRFYSIQRSTAGTHTNTITFIGLKLRYTAKR